MNIVSVMQECDLDQAFERSPSGCHGHRGTAVVPGLPLPFLLAGSSNVVHGCFFLLVWAIARCSRPCVERKGACRNGAGSCLHASLVGGPGPGPSACQPPHAEQAGLAGRAVAPAKQAAAAFKLGWTGCPTGYGYWHASCTVHLPIIIDSHGDKHTGSLHCMRRACSQQTCLIPMYHERRPCSASCCGSSCSGQLRQPPKVMVSPEFILCLWSQTWLQ